MATTALTAATNLLERIRDPLGLALSVIVPPSLAGGQAFAYSILSQAQRYINAIEENQILVVPYTLTPFQTVYEIDADPILGTGGSNPIVKVIGLRVGDTDIPYSSFDQLHQVDLRWFRAVGTQLLAWSRFGRDCFVAYPGLRIATAINLVTIPYLPDLTSGASQFAVTDDVIPQIMDLAEALALFKLGEYKLCAEPLKRLADKYKKELSVDVWKHSISGGEYE